MLLAEIFTGSTFVSRSKYAGNMAVAESLPDLFRLKAELKDRFRDVHIVLDDRPVVCAWYPAARSVLLWNLSESTPAA